MREEKMNEGNQLICYTLNSGLENVLSLIDPGKKTLLLVAGGSCSGKSFLANRIVCELTKEKNTLASRVRFDSCFRDIDDPELPHDDNGVNFDKPDSYHIDEFTEYIKKLLKGEDILYPIYIKRINKRDREKKEFIRAAGIIIAEGLFVISLLEDMKKRYNGLNIIKVFVDADKNLRLNRRIEKDQKYGIPKEVIIRYFNEKAEPGYQEYVLPRKETADIVIINNFERE